MAQEKSGLQRLLEEGPRSVNLGLLQFAESLRTQGAKVVHVEWTPPPPEVRDLEDILEELL